MEEQTNEHKSLFKQIVTIFREIIQLDEDTDAITTIASVKKSVEIKGANMWILAFAIIIASVGLNVNSTAVIIGAMLISPLMGPIIGIGLAVGTTDTELLHKSLINLLIMVFISLLSSTLYFLISPLSDAQSELLARTTPTIFDVVIAFFGGAAGIIASSRKEQSIPVISGVAIATALMPPLCTAGFGLATGQFHYFLGAFYLFFLNSFFIAFATFIFVRYLHFPYATYIDKKKQKFVKRSIAIFATIVIIPSIFMAIDVVKESAFQRQANKYINDIQKNELLLECQLISSSKEYNRHGSTIHLSLVGKTLSSEDIHQMQNILKYYGLTNTQIKIKQTGQSTELNIEEQAGVIGNLLAQKDNIIEKQDSTIRQLEKNITAQSQMESSYEQIAQEISIQFPFIETFSMAHTVQVNIKTMKSITIPTLYVSFSEEVEEQTKQQFYNWIKVRLSINNLNIVEL